MLPRPGVLKGSLNKLSLFGQAVWPAIANIYKDKDLNLKIPPIWETQTAQGGK